MSRRESRSSLGARQNDALFEFENFKKKFLLANKHITKLNSTLSVRIEELNAQISMLYVENLRLRASEIALASQLKREREHSRKVLADAEAASHNLAKHLNHLRDSLHPKSDAGAPPTPPSPLARRPIITINTTPTSPQLNRISRPPNVPGIYEDEEPCQSSSEEHDKIATPPRKKSKTKPRLSASKLPLPSRGASPTPSSTSGTGSQYVDLSTVPGSSKQRKTIRRQSGLLTVNIDSLSVPRSGSPAFGSPSRLEAGRAEEEEEFAVMHGELQLEIVEQEQEDETEVVLKKEKEKRKGKAKEQQRESESEKDAAGAGEVAPLPREKKKKSRGVDDPSDSIKPSKSPKESAMPRGALQPIDSNDEHIDVEAKVTSNRQFLRPVSPAGSAHTSRGSSSPAPPGSSDMDGLNAVGGRERRQRKSVNYAEPKLNTKMRKPDPPPGTAEPARKKRSSAAAVMITGTSYKPPLFSSNPNGIMDDGNDADGDTEARSSLEMMGPQHSLPPLSPPASSSSSSSHALPLRGMNGAYINPEHFPLPASRPGSAAAMYSPGPPTRTSGSTTSSVGTSTTTNATSAEMSSSTMATGGGDGSATAATAVRRKKSRSQLIVLSDEESDDGADADAEYVGAGGGRSSSHSSGSGVKGSGSGSWVNVEGRRKALPKRSAAVAAGVALEDMRRHSMAI